ncbi:M15 family metallopeptidase [Kribbella solani]|uniref:M15 family metallopeptidase n=1 Tax=Kribbella solani TaxID=236067 RepID=UPI0029A2906A|nr:M15 family metallopeptidase [Kribbella solani]MDX3004620.1 M15 family metallopeptidase [Kribbella solani]
MKRFVMAVAVLLTTPTPAPPTTATPPTPTPAVSTPAPVATTPAPEWSISLDQPAASWEDGPTVFTGKLSKPITGSYVTLWQRVPGAWVLRASTRTTAGGAYRFNYVSPSTGTWAFRTMIGVKAETALAISPYRTVPIQDRKIVINPPASWYATLTGVSVTGRTVPAEPRQELALQSYLGSGKWQLLGVTTVDAKGNFRFRVPDDLPATRTVRVVTRKVSQSAMEYSGLATIVIKAVLNPKVYAVSAAMVRYTYRAGCPVAPSSLRLLQLNYWGFDGRVHRGELILRDAAVAKMITVWTSTLAAKFPIRQMRRVDVFGGSDVKAMAADNTSAFNCRRVTGDPYSLSPHSYGWAIDVNTVENPYLAANGVWYPSNGLVYRNRSVVRPGMLFANSATTKALVGQGYFWGARWAKPDYQHFEPM